MKTCTKCGVEKEETEFYPKRPGQCKECSRAGSRAWKKANHSAVRAYGKTRHEENLARHQASSRAWKKANPEHHAAINREWFRTNSESVNADRRHRHATDPEKHNARNAAWKRANPAKVSAANMKREAAKIQQTPSWANDFFIEEIYDLAQRRTKITGFEWQVDHIVPLRGKSVRGLHVENNLRVIPAVINLAKGNRHWPEMPA